MHVTNSISGGVHHGVTIQGGDLSSVDLSSDGTNVTINGRAVRATTEPEVQDQLVADLREDLDRPGPRLAVLTKGESAAVSTLLSLVAEHPQLGRIADELGHRLFSRVEEHEV
ncbi:hypothetical protein ACQEU8_33405 [Streptomyces sp. CA-250714]|uniref:hypothetical protein n=1 Tax=Streptomyces sp. CA-250714 TaxID=3240060 RepID=UPI003D94D1BF